MLYLCLANPSSAKGLYTRTVHYNSFLTWNPSLLCPPAQLIASTPFRVPLYFDQNILFGTDTSEAQSVEGVRMKRHVHSHIKTTQIESMQYMKNV